MRPHIRDRLALGSNVMLSGKVEKMAEEEKQKNPEENTSQIPSDSELFVGQVREQLSEQDIFAGDEDFYKSLAASATTSSAKPFATTQKIAKAIRIPLPPIQHKRFSILQIALTAGIIIIGSVLLYALLQSPSQPVIHVAAEPKTAIQQQPVTAQPSITSQTVVPTQPKVVLPPTQPISLKIAEEFFLKQEYDKAYAVYEMLDHRLIESELMSDFFKLKMGFSAKNSGNTEQATQLFREVLQSRSPIIRVIANYNRSFDEIRKKQYLKARTTAYKTIALIDAVGFDMDWAFNVARNCNLLIAKSLTKESLLLYDADKDIPKELWVNEQVVIDPLIHLTERNLKYLLNYGTELLAKGSLSPQIEKSNSADSTRWSVICNGASIEELMTDFAANAGLDIYWSFGQNADSWNYKKRPTALYMPNVTINQFVETAAGSVGLLARIDENKTITILDTKNYASLSNHRSLLTQQAISLWQKFQLIYHNDNYIPNAHFALALLQAKRGQLTNAIDEYKLIANRFPKTSLAPFALLHSSKLKISIKDYMGARQDLKNLVELYPDSKVSSIGGLYLADATMKSKLYKEATRLYSKVYHLGLSQKLQISAALGAGKSLFCEGKDYKSTEKWLIRYINSETDRTAKDLYSAYILLGKTYLMQENHQKACDAFQYALEGRLNRNDYVETIFALVEGNLKLKNFIKALDILESIHSWQLSQEESVETLLLKSKTLRMMGLVDSAITIIGDRADYLSDNQLKARIAFELSNCYIANGDLKLARNSLIETLVIVEPGSLAHKIAFTLADIYLKLEQNSKTISVCLQLLDFNPSDRIKQKTLNLLASAYKYQKDYKKAADALMGHWSKNNAKNNLKTINDTEITNKVFAGI